MIPLSTPTAAKIAALAILFSPHLFITPSPHKKPGCHALFHIPC
jgi:hypothetical protein